MSDMFWENDDTEVRETNFAKAMREKAEKDSQTIKELKDLVENLATEVRSSRVEKVVTSKGLDPVVIELMKDAGVEASEQGAEAFLTKYGKLFAPTAAAPGTGEATNEPAPDGEQLPSSTVPAGEQAALSGQAAAAAGSIPQVGLEALGSQIKGVDNAEDLLKLIGANPA